MAKQIDPCRKLSQDVLAALQLAQELQEHEVAERLLQALELLSPDELENECLRAAYLRMARGVLPDVH